MSVPVWGEQGGYVQRVGIIGLGMGLGSSVHTELKYNSCTVSECISPVDP